VTIIIEDSPQLTFHSDLKKILEPILDEVSKFNWLCNNIGIYFDPQPFVNEIPADVKLQDANFDFYKSCILSGDEFSEVLKQRNHQYMWGIFSGFHGPVPEIPFEKRPYADGNEEIWINPDKFQIETAEIEIICFDSSCTILKFKNEEFAKRIMAKFPESKILMAQ
jgi:hypothetical protein